MLENLFEQLKRQESFRGKLYEDSRGFKTIGFGRLLEPGMGGGISLQEGLFMLSNDIYNARRQVDRVFPWSSGLEVARYHVLINMAFQMGIEGLGSFKKFLAHAQAGEHNDAAREMLDSRWATQTPSRAHELAGQWRRGEF